MRTAAEIFLTELEELMADGATTNEVGQFCFDQFCRVVPPKSPSTEALRPSKGDLVRVEGRHGFWPVWSSLSNEGRVMIEDMPGASVGPCVVLEVVRRCSDARLTMPPACIDAGECQHKAIIAACRAETAKLEPGAQVTRCSDVFTVLSVEGDWTWLRSAGGNGFKVRTEGLTVVREKGEVPK
jgi:hypothetical protein